MTKIRISLPRFLKSFVDGRIGARGYGSSSEHVRRPIRKVRDPQRLRGLLLEGAESMPAVKADSDYFDRLRARLSESGRP